MNTENQGLSSFFILDLKIEEENQTEHYLEKLENSVDLIFTAMTVETDVQKFQKEDKSRIIYFFKPLKRKRKGQLTKFCERFLPENQRYNGQGINSFEKDIQIRQLQKADAFKSEGEIVENDYDGSDVEIFNNPGKWFPWQKDVYGFIFNNNQTFQQPHPRHILSLVDIKGNSGKSSFFKWLYYKYPKEVGIIAYGSAAQLRSSVVNIGPKKLYIIDLARSKAKNDKEEDLLSVLEDLKSGLVINAMYGSGKTLLMEPPHIVVSSNHILNYKLLSEDRWQVQELQSNKKLGKINLLIQQQRKQETIKK